MLTYDRSSRHLRRRPGAARADEELTPAGRLLQLQRTAGNRAVVALLQRQEDENQDGPTEGSLPDQQVEASEEHEKGFGEEKEDGEGRAARRADPAPARPRPGRPIRVKDMGVQVDAPQLPETEVRPAGREDAIALGKTPVTWTNPGNKTVSPFGSESFNPGFSGLTWKSKGGVVELEFTLTADCPWGVTSGGKTDVPSASDSVVTKDSSEAIAADLTPSLEEKSWRAPRETYWSKAICERHEKYHSTDDKSWVEGPGKKVLADYLAKQTIDDDMFIPMNLAPIMMGAMKELQRANTAYYKGGATSYLSYAGEERAFGDGKVPYQELAAAVRKRGEELKKG